MMPRSLIPQTKYKIAMKGYAEIFNNAKIKKKHQYIFPIRWAGFSFSQAKELGFDIKRKLWLNCLNRSKRNKG